LPPTSFSASIRAEGRAAGAIVFLSFALVGLATGLGARYPRLRADSEPGRRLVRRHRFMMLAVLLIIV
jgi:hypothetical protein